MVDSKNYSNLKLVIVKIVMILLTFHAFSAFIFFLTEGKIIPKENDFYFFAFALSVFLGSAAYSLCHILINMSLSLILELYKTIKYFVVIAFIYTVVIWIVAVLTSYNIDSYLYAIGILIYLCSLAYIYVVIHKFDSELDKVIDRHKDEENEKLAQTLAKEFDKRYAKLGKKIKGKPKASQK